MTGLHFWGVITWDMGYGKDGNCGFRVYLSYAGVLRDQDFFGFF
jgi:hypothetical protein